jgi:hypothetical protein
MPGNDETNSEQEAIKKTANGKPLLLQSEGYLPLKYDDTNLYRQSPSIEIVLWLLTAAGSGIVGNIAYDTLKRLIQNAQKLHQKWLKIIEQDKQKMMSGEFHLPQSSRVNPDLSLRDDLVELAYDVLARYRNLQNSGPGKLISEIDVYLTRRLTWAVVTRELRAPEWIMVEIDLSEDMKRIQYKADKEVDGFPVSIWP